jgi:invasion protein IalB
MLLIAAVEVKAQQPQISPESSDTTSPPTAWSSTCSAVGRGVALDCAAEQRLVVSETGQLIGSISVRVPGKTRSPVMMIQTPVGLFLPAGVKIDVDGTNELQLELQTCDGSGCYAGSAVSDSLLTSMRQGRTLNIRFQNLTKKSIDMQISLIGFTAAYNKIK